jgi:serine/threonine protein phosphatase 1
MQTFLRKIRAIARQWSPDIGPDLRAYAIGDIHGRDDLFADLLRIIADDDQGRPRKPLHLILLGDLVDRGPQSAQVVERAMALAASGGHVHLIKGNHEEVFVAAARGDAQAARFFCRIGGGETLASYGLEPAECIAMGDAERADWMLRNIPRSHVDFLDDFQDSLILGDYLFVHAGIRPGVAIEAQSPADLRWIRAEFLDHAGDHGVMVVHGHSITDAPDLRANRIGIDTGASYSGRLTAIGLEGAAKWILQTSA